MTINKYFFNKSTFCCFLKKKKNTGKLNIILYITNCLTIQSSIHTGSYAGIISKIEIKIICTSFRHAI